MTDTTTAAEATEQSTITVDLQTFAKTLQEGREAVATAKAMGPLAEVLGMGRTIDNYAAGLASWSIITGRSMSDLQVLEHPHKVLEDEVDAVAEGRITVALKG